MAAAEAMIAEVGTMIVGAETTVAAIAERRVLVKLNRVIALHREVFRLLR
jgi:hypothetical protein